MDRDLGTNGFDKVGERMLSKLRSKNAQRIGFEKFYRRTATTCGRQGTLLITKASETSADPDSEYTSTSEGQDFRANGRMVRGVFEGS